MPDPQQPNTPVPHIGVIRPGASPDIMKVIDHMPHKWVREPDPDGVTRRGGHWEPIAPPPTPQQDQANTELMKQALTFTGGMIGGGGAAALLPEAATAIGASRYLPVATRILGSAFGGALGRMGGHVPEALVEQRTGRPSGTTFGRDAAIGGAEGALNEALPTMLEPATSTAGTVLKWLGRAGLDNPAASAAARAAMAVRRGWLAAPLSYLVGGPTGAAIDAVASLGPVVSSQAGQGLENLAPKLGSRTLSERAEGPLKALVDRLTPAATPAEQLAAGAEKYAAGKAGPWAVPRPATVENAAAGTANYERAAGAPHVNPFGFTSEGPPQPFAPTSAAQGAKDMADYSWEDFNRGGRAPGRGADVRVNPTGFTSESIPSGAAPDVVVSPRGYATGTPSGEAPPVTVNPRGFGESPQSPEPPDLTPTAGREGFAASHPGPGRAPDVDTVTPTGAPQREPSRGPAGPAPPPNDVTLQPTVNPVASDIGSQVVYERDPVTGAYAPSAQPAGRANPGAGSVDALIERMQAGQAGPTRAAPANAAEALAQRLQSPSMGEMYGSRLFKGTLDNELRPDWQSITIPAEHAEAAAAYVRQRLGDSGATALVDTVDGGPASGDVFEALKKTPPR